MNPTGAQGRASPGQGAQGRASQAPRIELTIGQVTLYGVAPTDQDQFAEAIRQELSQLLAQGLPDSLRQGGAIPSLRAGSIQLTPGAEGEGQPPAGPRAGLPHTASARSLGRQVARALYDGMKGGDPL